MIAIQGFPRTTCAMVTFLFLLVMFEIDHPPSQEPASRATSCSKSKCYHDADGY